MPQCPKALFYLFQFFWDRFLLKRGVVNSPAQYFRAGAGAVIVNTSGCVLALERADIPGAWQFPQGGLKPFEEPVQAAFREVLEETGLSARDVELIDSYPEPLVYELPADACSEKTGRGQVQYWYLFRLTGSDAAIDVKSSGEFCAWKWVPFQTMLHTVADFRKNLYQKLGERFKRSFL